MDMKKLKNSKRGSLTAEATIVLPVVIFVIMIIIRLCIIHYQNVVVSAEAMRVASRTAMYWQDIGNNNPAVFQDTVETKKWITDSTFKDHDPYAMLVELIGAGDARTKINNATAYAGKVMNKTPNLLGEDTAVKGVTVKRDLGLLQTYITVTVTRKNENPLGYLYEKLGMTSPDEYKVTAKGIQADTTEFIRNVSLLYDAVKGDLIKEETEK